MQPDEFIPGGGEGSEVRGERNARQLPFEDGSVAFAVARMMEQGVDVVEDVFPREGVAIVVLADLLDGGVFQVTEGGSTNNFPGSAPLAAAFSDAS